ncbi:MAG: hypothetical protein KKB30_00335 [Proteobacteria bacterium]|nr:hypothetical protein [Pseudomonadota bacterium]
MVRLVDHAFSYGNNLKKGSKSSWDSYLIKELMGRDLLFLFLPDGKEGMPVTLNAEEMVTTGKSGKWNIRVDV